MLITPEMCNLTLWKGPRAIEHQVKKLKNNNNVHYAL